ncbi:MAG: CBO0543 family protein [Bacillus sp. (in: firmicutes)]
MKFVLLHEPTYLEINQEKSKLLKLIYSHWINHDLFSLNWWILICATIFPYFIWWRFVKKDRFFEIFCYGLLCSCFSIILDVIGTEMMLWGYPDKLVPWIPPLLPADFVIIPITAMIVYQRFETWKSFLLANFCWAILFSYIIEPFFVKLGMFALGNHWCHTYSFFGFFLLGIVLKLFITRLKKKVGIP